VITLESRIRRSPNVAARPLAEGEGVLLHLESGAYHGLNPVGLAIWELLDDEQDVRTLVDRLRDQVTGAPASLEQDVLSFLSSAAERDLVVVE
jgi:hypothetical protein